MHPFKSSRNDYAYFFKDFSQNQQNISNDNFLFLLYFNTILFIIINFTLFFQVFLYIVFPFDIFLILTQKSGI